MSIRELAARIPEFWDLDLEVPDLHLWPDRSSLLEAAPTIATSAAAAANVAVINDPTGDSGLGASATAISPVLAGASIAVGAGIGAAAAGASTAASTAAAAIVAAPAAPILVGGAAVGAVAGAVYFWSSDNSHAYICDQGQLLVPAIRCQEEYNRNIPI